MTEQATLAVIGSESEQRIAVARMTRSTTFFEPLATTQRSLGRLGTTLALHECVASANITAGFADGEELQLVLATVTQNGEFLQMPLGILDSTTAGEPGRVEFPAVSVVGLGPDSVMGLEAAYEPAAEPNGPRVTVDLAFR